MADDELPEGWPQSDGTRPNEGAHWASSAAAALPILAAVVVVGLVATHAGAVVGGLAAAVWWLFSPLYEQSPVGALWLVWAGSRLGVWQYRRSHVTVKVVRLPAAPLEDDK